MKNNYFLLRHGETISTKKEICSSWPEKIYNPLTLKGRKQIKEAAKKLKKEKTCPVGPDLSGSCGVDLIFSSDLLRTKQTAGIILKIIKGKVKYDKRLRELDMGIFNGTPLDNLVNFRNGKDRLKTKIPKGEGYEDVERRIKSFCKELERKYSRKNILIISHQIPLFMFEFSAKGISKKEIREQFFKEEEMVPGELRQI